MSGIPLAVALVAVVVATVLAAADAALLGADPEPEQVASRGVAAWRRERSHRALSLARVLAHLFTGASAALAFHVRRGSGARGAAVAFAVALVAVTIVEGVGRAYGFAHAKRLRASLAPVTRIVELVLTPVLRLGTALDALFERLMPAPSVEQRLEQREEATEQFRQVVTAEADVSRDEEKLLHGVFSLGDTTVREVMVPRVSMVGIDHTIPWSEAVDRVRSSEHARFPVYDETIDNVLGILYAKDLLPFVIDDDEPMLGWQTLIRPATFIPTSKLIDVQLRDFKASHTHIAIVSDEFGGTAGLVTIEDVLEEIVGEIHDEYDEEDPEIEQEAGGHYWVSGRLSLDELSEVLSQDFAREDVTTVGGLVYEEFGRVPNAGESLQVGAYKLVVERVRQRRIERVYFERTRPAGRGDE